MRNTLQQSCGIESHDLSQAQIMNFSTLDLTWSLTAVIHDLTQTLTLIIYELTWILAF